MAGNESADSGGVAVTIDTVAPGVPEAPTLPADSDSGISQGDGITNEARPTFEVSVGPDYFRFYRDGEQISGDYDSGPTYTPAEQSDDSYTYTVRAVDAAGNESGDSGGVGVTIDTAAPGAPEAPVLEADSDSGVLDDDGITNDETPTFEVTVGSDYFRFYRDGGQISGNYESGGSYTAAVQSDDSYTYTVRAVDAAGNESGDSGGVGVTIDTAAPGAPEAPVLEADSDSGVLDDDGITNDETPTFEVTVGSDYFRFYRDGGQISGDYESGPTYTADGQADGEDIAYTVRAVDVAGNESADSGPATVTIDTQCPEVEEDGFARLGQDGNPWQWYPTKYFGISITFSEDVSATVDGQEPQHFHLYNLCAEEPLSLEGVEFSYDPVTNTDTWVFGEDGWDMDPAWYRVTVGAAGVTDVAGNLLDGDSNGTGGDDYGYGQGDDPTNILLRPLGGDVNLDGEVDRDDFAIIEENWGSTDATWPEGDLNLNTVVDFYDYLLWKATVSRSLGCDMIAPWVTLFERLGPDGDPWEWRPTELYQIRITFSEDVSPYLDAGDLLLYNQSTQEYVSLDGVEFTYDSETDTATWDFGGQALPAGWYLVTIDAGGVTDLAGNPLDGNADGTEGDDYEYGDDAGTEDEMLLPILGDLDLDGDVDWDDLMTLLASYECPVLPEEAWENGDIDYSLFVDSDDLSTLLASYNLSLPR